MLRVDDRLEAIDEEVEVGRTGGMVRKGRADAGRTKRVEETDGTGFLEESTEAAEAGRGIVFLDTDDCNFDVGRDTRMDGSDVWRDKGVDRDGVPRRDTPIVVGVVVVVFVVFVLVALGTREDEVDFTPDAFEGGGIVF